MDSPWEIQLRGKQRSLPRDRLPLFGRRLPDCLDNFHSKMRDLNQRETQRRMMLN